MKSLLFYSLIFCFALSACSKKSSPAQSASTAVLPYDSPIQYVYSPEIDKDNAAMVDGTPVSWSQLASQDVALQELQQRLDSKAIEFVLNWSRETQPETKSLTLFIKQPEDKVAASMGRDEDSNPQDLKIEFVDNLNSNILAKSDKAQLTWAQFLESDLSYSKLYEQVYKQRLQRLNGIVVRRYLLQSSKQENLAMENFVKDKILKGPLEVSDEDVEAFAKEKNISESDITEEMMARLKDIVLQNKRDKKIENYVAEKLMNKPVQVAFMAPLRKISTDFINDDIYHWGEAKNATLVYFGHWDCEECKSSLRSFLELKKDWSKQLTAYFIHSFPERDRLARMEAEAGFCVGSIDQGAYWNFMADIIESEQEDPETKINTAAKNSGVDFEQFRDCFLKRKFQSKVDTHLQYANKMGITSPPLIVLNDLIIESLNANDLKSSFKELGLKGGASKQGLWARIKSFFGF